VLRPAGKGTADDTMTVHFGYDKTLVLQALRYHFLSRKEIRFMIILVNVFALLSAALFYFKKILPPAFFVSTFLWIVLMLSFWFVLPGLVYRRAATFQDQFTMDFEENGFSLGNERGGRQWSWKTVSHYLETPHFFHLYFNATSFFLIPKKAFNHQQLTQMRDMLRKKINPIVSTG
jgi:hypothetical protein